MERKKIAVLFPGMGYGCDRPLLYYSGKLAQEHGYKVMKVSYPDTAGMPTDDMFAYALARTEDCLRDVRWEEWDDILFICKSLGTIAAPMYAEKYHLDICGIYLTPVPQSFLRPLQDGIAFSGSNDHYITEAEVRELCAEQGIPLQIIRGGNHSLETENGTEENLRILQTVMSHVSRFLSGC